MKMNKMLETVKGVGSMTVGAAVLTVQGTKKHTLPKVLLGAGVVGTVLGIISSTTVATVAGIGVVGAGLVVGFKQGIDDVINEAGVVQ